MSREVINRYQKYVCNNKPEITVFMTVHNREKYICEAIESVLSNTLKNYYFIFLDNCSTDKTAALIKGYVNKNNNLGYIYRESTNDYPNFQYAVDICITDYFVVLHDDDVVCDNLLDRLLFNIKKLNCIALSSNMKCIDEYGCDLSISTRVDRLMIFEHKDYLLNYFKLNRVTMCCPATIYYKPFLKEEKIKWNFNAGPCVDDYFYFQICRYGGRIAILPEKLINYRIHSGQDSNVSKAFMYLKLYDFILDDMYYRSVLIDNRTRIIRDIWFSFKQLFKAYNKGVITIEEYNNVFNYKCWNIISKTFRGKILWFVTKYVYSHNSVFCLLMKVRRR